MLQFCAKTFGNCWQQLLVLAAVSRNNKASLSLPNDYVMSECFQIQFIQSRLPMGEREGVALVLPLELDYTCWPLPSYPHYVSHIPDMKLLTLVKRLCHSLRDWFLSILSVGFQLIKRGTF